MQATKSNFMKHLGANWYTDTQIHTVHLFVGALDKPPNLLGPNPNIGGSINSGSPTKMRLVFYLIAKTTKK